MHQILLLTIILMLFLLLITTVVSAVTVEVIEDGTPEGQDMAKALALSKRFFWRNMMANWSHYIDYEAFSNHEQIGEISREESRQLIFLKDLRQALATDAYVKCWECKQTNADDEAGSSSLTNQLKKDQFKCLCVKPKFLVEQGELQLSSAMEAIKSVYRDLFRWGSGFLSFEINFVNQKAWYLVHHWQLSYANWGSKLAENILLKVKEQLVGDDDTISLSKSILASMNELKYEETMPNGEKRDYLKELNAILKQAEMFSDLPKKIKKGKAEHVDLNAVVKVYQNYWELVQEFGLGMAAMCEGATKVEKIYDNTMHKFVEIFKAFGRVFQELSGTLLWRLRRMVHDMMLQMNHGNELKPLLPDPCEEAKFKVGLLDFECRALIRTLGGTIFNKSNGMHLDIVLLLLMLALCVACNGMPRSNDSTKIQKHNRAPEAMFQRVAPLTHQAQQVQRGQQRVNNGFNDVINGFNEVNNGFNDFISEVLVTNWGIRNQGKGCDEGWVTCKKRILSS
uniref:Uncharacterized protein n=1 Tax=Globodera rostochiensis TaxID=31243 RepID=A0A914HAC5_GLORO